MASRIDETEAWVIERGAAHKPKRAARLMRRQLPLRPLQSGELLVEPLLGCWEANMTHAIERRPIDICHDRDEPFAVVGNTGVVRVLKSAGSESQLREGDTCIVIGIGTADAHGFVDRVFAYDCPGTTGLLAKRTIMKDRQLIKIPDGTRWSTAQWAAFSGRYVTAWANWHLAYGCWQQFWRSTQAPQANVWGWGGGVSIATLELAQRSGCATAMMATGDKRLELLRAKGIQPVDRRCFSQLSFDTRRYKRDPDYREAYRQVEDAFLGAVSQLTQGAMVSIFVDYIGLPVWRATLRALGRPGVVTSAGWKRGMNTESVRALECMRWHAHVYTHYARYYEAQEAVLYAEREAWIPDGDMPIYSWTDVPKLARDYASDSVTSYFPLYQVNPI